MAGAIQFVPHPNADALEVVAAVKLVCEARCRQDTRERLLAGLARLLELAVNPPTVYPAGMSSDNGVNVGGGPC